MHTINIVCPVFAIVAMYPVSSGFEEWIHLFVQDSFGQKRETLPGAIVIRVEPSLAGQTLSGNLLLHVPRRNRY